MKRIPVTPRSDYREKIEVLGFDFHGDYWREEAYYRFTAEETACLEEATNEAYRLYCEAAQFIIEDNPEFMERALNIPKEIGERIRASWGADELSLYGRFDFILAKDGTPKILEFNADTPTSLLEASVIQWQWKEDVFRNATSLMVFMKDWCSHGKIFPQKGEIHFAGALENNEDTGTLQYLASTAMEAGFSTRVLDMQALDLQNGRFLIRQVN